jgi:DNA-binding transcriptional ArsR family regulator
MIETDDIYKAIADPTRRKILDLLRLEGALRAGDIASAFPKISRPAVSKHLRVLREADLIEEQSAEDGRERRYHLKADPLQAVNQWLSHYDSLWDKRFETLKALIEADELTKDE